MSTDSKAALPASVIEVVPGRLYAIGGGIASDQSVSWFPDQTIGWMPMQCYCLVDGDKTLLLDCGLPAHSEDVMRGIEALTAGRAAPNLLISYWEPGAIGELPALVKRFGIKEVITYAGLNPFDFFENFEEAVAQSQLEARKGNAKPIPLMPGEFYALGGLRVEAISPALRVLLTTWYYEESTKSLFTADAFPMLPNSTAPRPYVTTPPASALTPDAMEHWLSVKFSWLTGAFCEEIVADLEQLVTRLDIERICPSIGAIIEGRDAVRQVFASTVAALHTMSKYPRKSVFDGFDWNKALTADPVF